MAGQNQGQQMNQGPRVRTVNPGIQALSDGTSSPGYAGPAPLPAPNGIGPSQEAAPAAGMLSDPSTEGLGGPANLRPTNGGQVEPSNGGVPIPPQTGGTSDSERERGPYGGNTPPPGWTGQIRGGADPSDGGETQHFGSRSGAASDAALPGWAQRMRQPRVGFRPGAMNGNPGAVAPASPGPTMAGGMQGKPGAAPLY